MVKEKQVSLINLKNLASELLTKHRSIVSEIELLLRSVEKEDIKEFLTKKLENSKTTVETIEKGFIPVSVDSPISLKTKSEAFREEIKEMMKTLPPEAKDALERAKKLGIFDQFAISGGPRGGDPVIVGIRGNRCYLIAAWVNIDGGGAIGYTFKDKEEICS